MLEIINRASGSDTVGTYIDGNYTIAYQVMPKYNFVLTMRYETAKLMSDSYAIKQTIVICVLAAMFVIILGTIVVSRIITNPLNGDNDNPPDSLPFGGDLFLRRREVTGKSTQKNSPP